MNTNAAVVAPQNTVVKIIPSDKGNPPGKLADAEIHFVDGAIYNALYSSLRGDEAFYAMLALTDGDFMLEPNFRAPQQVIHASPEALLLEGMRRQDESGR